MKPLEMIQELTPFANCPALAGYHCWSNSIAKIYFHYGLPLSEEMLFGLGAGLGFMYWEQRGSPPFIGGRGNTQDFVQDIAVRTGVRVAEKSTGSDRTAQKLMLQQLDREEPQMVRVDMGFLPYFDFGDEEYHFGSHTVVICGYDGQDRVLVSDIDQAARGKKHGFYAPLTLVQIGRARGSTFKPFPPKNTYFEFDFAGRRLPDKEAICSAISQNCEAMLHPPIRNLGVSGIRRAAAEIRRWPERFSDADLRNNLFMFYIMVEVGGTGGGMFRPLYGRFLSEAAAIAGNDALEKAASQLHHSGARFTEAALLLEDVLHGGIIEERVERTAAILEGIAQVEEEAFTALLTAVE